MPATLKADNCTPTSLASDIAISPRPQRGQGRSDNPWGNLLCLRTCTACTKEGVPAPVRITFRDPEVAGCVDDVEVRETMPLSEVRGVGPVPPTVRPLDPGVAIW